MRGAPVNPQFTCFTSIKVRILTLTLAVASSAHRQMLTHADGWQAVLLTPTIGSAILSVTMRATTPGTCRYFSTSKAIL